MCRLVLMVSGGMLALVERRVVRRTTGTFLLLAVLIALSAGAAMAAVAGGRRAATSYDRLIAWSSGTVANISGSASGDSVAADQNLARIAALPDVERSMRSLVLGDGVAVRGERVPWPALLPIALDVTEPALGRFKLLSGRLPDVRAVDEAIVPFDTAERFDLNVGDTVDVVFEEWDNEPSFLAGVETVTLVGVVAYPGSFPSVTTEPTAVVILTPAFVDAHPERIDWTNSDLQVRLRDSSPAGVEAFRNAVAETGIPVDFVGSIYDDAIGVRKVVRVEAGVLWLVALVIAAASLVVAVQIFNRAAAGASDELTMLRSLGMSRSMIAAAGALHGLRVGAVAAIGAVVAAVGSSALLPRGVARTADPDVGIHADAVVLGIGVVLVVSIVTAIGAGSAVWVVRSRNSTPAANSLVGRLVGRLPPAPAFGVRSALAPAAGGTGSSHGRLVGLALILTALVAVVAMRASFDRVLDQPAISGATWDMTANYDDVAVADSMTDTIAADPVVAAFTRGGWTEIDVNGKPVYTVYLEPNSDVHVATDRGRAPAEPSEIALGRAELDALGVSIGDTVRVALPESAGEAVTATVTGRAVVAAPFYQSLEPGEGGAVTVGLMQQLLGERPWTGYFIVFADGQNLRQAWAGLHGRIEPSFSFPRADRAGVRSLRDVRQLPSALLVLLSMMAAAALVHRLVLNTSVAHRELALLRSLGFTSRQFSQAGAAQGAAISALVFVVAIPAGLLGAAVGWRGIAEYLRVVPSVAAPFAFVAIGAAGVAALAITSGIVLSKRARRTSAGLVLRTE